MALKFHSFLIIHCCYLHTSPKQIKTTTLVNIVDSTYLHQIPYAEEKRIVKGCEIFSQRNNKQVVEPPGKYTNLQSILAPRVAHTCFANYFLDFSILNLLARHVQYRRQLLALYKTTSHSLLSYSF